MKLFRSAHKENNNRQQAKRKLYPHTHLLAYTNTHSHTHIATKKNWHMPFHVDLSARFLFSNNTEGKMKGKRFILSVWTELQIQLGYMCSDTHTRRLPGRDRI